MAAWSAMTSFARRLGISRSSYSRGFQKVYSLWTAMKSGFDNNNPNRECGRLTLVRAIEPTLHSSGVRGSTCGVLPLILLLYWAPSARSERSLMPNLTVTFAHVTMPVPCPTTNKRYTLEWNWGPGWVGQFINENLAIAMFSPSVTMSNPGVRQSPSGYGKLSSSSSHTCICLL